MNLPSLEPVTLRRRYKRFLADVERADGELLTVHCPNTGAMTGCALPGSAAWISRSDNAERKYPHTLELVQSEAGLVSVNTHRANALVGEALQQQVIESLPDWQDLTAEVKIPDESGRFDFAVKHPEQTMYIEVKSVTLHISRGMGAFPDAVSQRALKHVDALLRRVRQGDRALLVFCAQHLGIEQVRVAEDIDPAYAVGLAQATRQGLEVRAYGCAISEDMAAMYVDRQIPFVT